MADVYAVVFTLIGVLVSTPALLVALNLLLPRATTKTYLRLKHTPVKSFFVGIPSLLFLLGWMVITGQVNLGPVQATAFVAGLGGMAIGAVGGAGIARLLGERVAWGSEVPDGTRALIRGAVVYELACLVPIVGWFVFAPLVGTAAFGAALLGLAGWAPDAGEAEPASELPAARSMAAAGRPATVGD